MHYAIIHIIHCDPQCAKSNIFKMFFPRKCKSLQERLERYKIDRKRIIRNSLHKTLVYNIHFYIACLLLHTGVRHYLGERQIDYFAQSGKQGAQFNRYSFFSERAYLQALLSWCAIISLPMMQLHCQWSSRNETLSLAEYFCLTG